MLIRRPLRRDTLQPHGPGPLDGMGEEAHSRLRWKGQRRHEIFPHSHEIGLAEDIAVGNAVEQTAVGGIVVEDLEGTEGGKAAFERTEGHTGGQQGR